MKSKNKLTGQVLSFDVGIARTGVARLHTIARLAEPLDPIVHAKISLNDGIKNYIDQYEPVAVVVGLPRGLDGQETEQTRLTRAKFDELLPLFQSRNIASFLVDEAGTTKEAESIASQGQSIDSVAAGIIVESWAKELMSGKDDTYEI